jgi:hypothetical protein
MKTVSLFRSDCMFDVLCLVVTGSASPFFGRRAVAARDSIARCPSPLPPRVSPQALPGSRLLALFDWSGAPVLAVKFDQIEGAKDGSVVMAPGAEQIKGGEATLINHGTGEAQK